MKLNPLVLVWSAPIDNIMSNQDLLIDFLAVVRKCNILNLFLLKPSNLEYQP